MMSPSRNCLAAAALMLLSTGSLLAQTCTVDPASPFTAGPADAVSKFPQWIVDANGLGLSVCTDSVDGLGNPPPCFYDPVIADNAYSARIGRGNEAFYFLADNVFTTTGAAAVDAVIVMAVESAFLSPEPVDGYQTQFQRLRIRVNVGATGIYTVEHPWGSKTYRVETLLPPGNGQNRMEISDPTDISFPASASVKGMVTPFLRWDASAPAAPAGYLGDGVTLHPVLGSPCGQNFVRISAVQLDGVTPIAIDPTDADGDGSTSRYTSRNFTVMGKLLPASVVPLAVGNAYYSRVGGATTLNVLAQSSPTASVTATPGGALAGDGTGRYFLSAPYSGATLPATLRVTASDPANGTQPNDQTAVPLRDLVTITRAEAVCSAAAGTCSLAVDASSSDQTGTPALTLSHSNTRLTNGSVTLTGQTALPAEVVVTSAAGGAAALPVRVTRQP